MHGHSDAPFFISSFRICFALSSQESYCYVCPDIAREFAKYEQQPAQWIKEFRGQSARTGQPWSCEVGPERFLGPELFFVRALRRARRAAGTAAVRNGRRRARGLGRGAGWMPPWRARRAPALSSSTRAAARSPPEPRAHARAARPAFSAEPRDLLLGTHHASPGRY